MFDFFISHSSEDKEEIVDKLVQGIVNNGHTVWYDKTEIVYGNNINSEIDDGLRQSFCLVLIVTKHFFNSKWVFFEFGKYSAYQKARIIPIIYDISTEEYLQVLQILGNVKYINARGRSVSQVVNMLEDALVDTKEHNESLSIKDELQKLYKNIKSHEDINSGIVCTHLTEYFEMMNNHPTYVVFAAKKTVKSIIRDSVKFFYIKVNYDESQETILEILKKLEGRVSRNIIEYFSFLLNADLEKYSSDYLDLINKSLVAILKWYCSLKYPEYLNRNYFSFEVLQPGEMKHSDFYETDEIDYLVLREDLIASVETAIEWYDYNYYTYLAIREKRSQRIAGYITLLPITEDTYNQIMSGDFMDKEFTKESLLQYEAPGLYTIYVASVAIHPNYQNTNAFLELYNIAIDMFVQLAEEREIFVEKILAEASTNQGEKLCKLLGMKKHCSSTSGTDIYTLTLIPPEFKLFGAKGKVFMNLCMQKYNEYREYF